MTDYTPGLTLKTAMDELKSRMKNYDRLKQERDELLEGLKKIADLTDYWKGSAVVTSVSFRKD